jgi:hypothetical protein
VSVQGGEGGGRGGNVHLLGGETSGNSNPGGNVKVKSGRSASGSGEVVTDSSSSATSGETILTSGSASSRVSSSSGVVRVTSGESPYGNSGDIVVESSQVSLSGNVHISSGDAYSTRSGDIVLNSGRAALSRGPGVSGKVSLGTSAMTNGDSGDIELLTGDSMSGTSGNVTIATVKPIYSQAIPTNGDSQGAWRRMMLGSGE